MKLNNNYMLALLSAGLLITNSVSAQWTRNAATQQTYLTNTSDFVGIGTANPAYKLDVVSSGIATMQFKSTTDNASILLERGSATSTASLTYKSAGAGRWQTGIVSNDNYQIRNNVLASPAMVILSANSNVGIGTANPTSKLQVVGNIAASGNVSAVNVTASGTVSGATVTSSGNVNAANFFGSGNIDVSGYVGFGSVERLTDGGSNTIASNSSFVPTIDCGGSLGFIGQRWSNVNVCTSVGIGLSGAAAVPLQVDGGTDVGPAGGGYFVAGATTGSNIGMDNNEIMARNNGAVSDLFINNNGGNVLINGAGSGDVGIGTSSPGNRLHVHQTVANRAIQWQHESTADFWTVGIGTSTLNCRFEFNGAGKGQISSVDGTYSTISDARLKEEITPLTPVLDKVMKLAPSEYYYTSSRKQAINKSTGFIAQDVEKVFPQLIHNDDEGYKWLSYSEFGVIAIKAIQEQQKTIDKKSEELNSVKAEVAQLNEMVTKLDNALAQCCSNYSNEKSATGLSTDGAKLEQNAPNPFSQSTLIKFYIPQNFKSATVKVYSTLGEEMKSFNIGTSGVGQVEISGNTMAAGIYNYTLMIDGKAIDSKQMILTK